MDRKRTEFPVYDSYPSTDSMYSSQAFSGNSTSLVNLEDLKMDSNFAMLLCSLVFSISWCIYILYYNSRVVGYIITKVANRLFIRRGYFQIGSLSMNALSGKIMFRDIVYITHDYTVRIQDGYVIFRWWRSYVPKDVSEDLSHSDTRLSVVLNGFELHVYNRSHLYSHLEKTFGLDPNIFQPGNDSEEAMNVANTERNLESRTPQDVPTAESRKKQRPEAAMARTWRDLIPVIKMDISTCRIVFGNRSVPTTLSITVEESHFVYSTKPAVCALDMFMHFVKCKAENVRVMLAPSPKYTGMLDEPPRYMGEGFVLMSNNDMELYFYMDEAGLVPLEPVLITLANGDRVESSPPQWGIDLKCGKCTDFSYGPWADRQREHLFKFFYPSDYTPMPLTPAPKPGDKRQMQTFDVRLSMQNEATIDILFSKDKETNAVHVNVGAGSYLEITIPWMVGQEGFVTKINGQLLHLDATTSLQYRDFVVSETLEFCLLCKYPRIWNEEQLWELSMTGCKATVHILFCHKWFFTDFINDWSSKSPPDILHFVPYTWRFGLTVKHAEILTFVNQHNWMDCSSVGQKNRLENTQIALCAHFLHLSFDLPFDEFLPESVPINFSIQGESIDLSLFIPEFHTSRNIVLALEKYAKVRSKDGSTTKKTEIIPKWRNICQKSLGWIDFWWVPIGAINIVYTYHPCPPVGPSPQADISTPVKEDILLSPIRIPHTRKTKKRSPEGVQKFDPTVLKSDTVTVELEIGPSILLLYGTALRNFINFKENIFGEDQMFTDLQQTATTDNTGNSGNIAGTGNPGADLRSDSSVGNLPLEMREDFDHRYYRPLDVDVSIVIHDVQGHLLKNCTEKDAACPVILVERFGFELKKRYEQTELQLLLSPAVLLVSDNLLRPTKDKHLSQGRLTLSSLQIRGHAMFSDVGRPLDQDTIEYAWLVELQLGKLSGKLTMPQLHSVVACMETLLLLMCDTENELNSPGTQVALHESPVHDGKTGGFHQMQQAIQQFLQPRSNNAAASISAAAAQSAAAAAAVVGTAGGGGGGSAGINTAGGGGATGGGDGGNGAIGGGVNAGASNSGQRSVQMERKKKPIGSELSDSVEDLNAASHSLKYKFTRLAVDAIDLWLVESGAAMQMWVSPIRLSTCNLHGKQVGSGLSCLIFGMSLRTLVWQPHKYNHSKPSSGDSCDLWLEVGKVNFAPLLIEAATSTPNTPIPTQNIKTPQPNQNPPPSTTTTTNSSANINPKTPSAHASQQTFLKMHDERHRKLWFLWMDNMATSSGTNMAGSKCGCSGGCMFFGGNRNGQRFFRPSRKDLEDGTNVAAFRVNDKGDPGYGQSLLHDGMLIFRTPPYIVSDITLQDNIMAQRSHPVPPPTALLGVVSVPVATVNQLLVGQSTPLRPERGDSSNDVGGCMLVHSLDRHSDGGGGFGGGGKKSGGVGGCGEGSRRYSSTSIRSASQKNVPYARLVECTLPAKLDSDSKLNTADRGKLNVAGQIDGVETLPKNSASDSKLAIGYFDSINAETDDFNDSGPSSDPIRHIDSKTSLNRQSSAEKLEKEVQRTISMSSENHSEAFFSADEDMHINSRSSSLRNSILSSNGTLTRQGSNASSNQASKKCASDLSIAANKAISVISSSAPNHSEDTTNRSPLSTYRSDNEIHTPEHRSYTSGNKDDRARTVHGLITPQRHPQTAIKPNLKPSTLSVDTSATTIAQQQLPLTEDQDTHVVEDDSTSSYSDNSYASAVGSQEDFTLVDLHMQVNRQIVDSPMLLSSYVTHLNQLRCLNWHHNSNSSSSHQPTTSSTSTNNHHHHHHHHQSSIATSTAADQQQSTASPTTFTAPLFQKCLVTGKLVYSGARFVPHMESIHEGVTALKMTSQSGGCGTGGSAGVFSADGGQGAGSHQYLSSTGVPITGAIPGNTPQLYYSNWEDSDENNDDVIAGSGVVSAEEELLGCQTDNNSSRISVIVKLKGDLDIMISPLLLETLQRYIDAVTPTVSHLHPLTVVNHLHACCIGQVESANVLKTPENIAKLSQKNENGTDTKGVPNNSAVGMYEETIKEVLQAAVILPKINITMLQVSIVEEIISFSALDNIKDLTCVSMFSVSFDNFIAKFHFDKQRREVLQKLYRPAVVSTSGKKGNKAKQLLRLHTTSNAPDVIRGEPVYVETSRGRQQVTVICVQVGKVHAQLRRLRNESSLLDDAIITAIPAYSNKVLFRYSKVPAWCRSSEYYLQQPHNRTLSDEQSTAPYTSTDETTHSGGVEEKLGFVMFEGGLEGISVKIVQKSQQKESDSNLNDSDLEPTVPEETTKPSKDDAETNTISDRNSLATPKLGEQKSSGGKIVSGDGKSKPEPKQMSQKSTEDGGNKEVVVSSKAKDNGNVSSCVIEFKVVWFNFAAPPKAPITRKIDYTRLDWNLLSTASPAINAWMNPSNRLAIRVVHMFRSMYKRSTATVACLMTEALDEHSVHLATKSRYGKLTPLSKTLHEDPSCQLCTVLQKYYLQAEPSVIEVHLRENDLPQLFTLRQGVIVLSRQWKNILYTPLLPQTNSKIKLKPVNVTISVPEIEEEVVLTDGENSVTEENDITDEHARLLHSGIILKPNKHIGLPLNPLPHHHHHHHLPNQSSTLAGAVNGPGQFLSVGNPVPSAAILASPQVSMVNYCLNDAGEIEVMSGTGVAGSPPAGSTKVKPPRPLKPPSTYAPPTSSRGSIVLAHHQHPPHFYQQPRKPNTSAANHVVEQPDFHPYVLSGRLGNQLGSDLSVYDDSSPDVTVGSPIVRRMRSSEDLYNWMARQGDGDGGGVGFDMFAGGTGGGGVLGANLEGCLESKIDTWPADTAIDIEAGKDIVGPPGISMYHIHDSPRLMDANLIFRPLLLSLGVMPQQLRLSSITDPNTSTTDIATMDALGSNLSLVGNMETMRIDIVVSEHGKMESKKNAKGKGKGRLYLEINTDDCPAFVCEKVSVELDIDRLTDMASNDAKNVLYMSRGQLKNHTNTVVNFSIGVRYISQRVNMPLLRLLHQISNMYQNVKDTQNELREQQPVDLRRPKTSASDHTDIKHRSASASDLQQSDTLLPPSSQLPITTSQIGANSTPKPPSSLRVSEQGSIASSHYDTSANTKTKMAGGATVMTAVISPSPSLRRPHSFAQKLRSTGKTVRGYVNLSDFGANSSTGGVAGGGNTPVTLSSPSGSALEHITVSSEKSVGRCWKTIYHLLDLYGNVPDTRTIRHRFSVGPNDMPEQFTKGSRKYDVLNEVKSVDDIEKRGSGSPIYQREISNAGEHTKLVVFGVARIHRTRLLATLSVLKLEAEITNLHSSLTCKKRSNPANLEISLTGQVGRTMIMLLEGVAPNQQTVVKVTVGKSQALYSSVSKRSKNNNSGLLTVGAVNIDIPQHPVALHGMVTRGSKQLSSTLQELRVNRTSSRLSSSKTVQHDDDQPQQPSTSSPGSRHLRNIVPNTASTASFLRGQNAASGAVTAGLANEQMEQSLLQPLVMQFSIILQSLSITAALLPSLQAQYKMDQVNSSGVTGGKAKFTIDLPHHSLSFTTKLQVTEANLPSEASIALPAVHVSAEYIPEAVAAAPPLHTTHVHSHKSAPQEGLVFMQGGYLSAHADIGDFEHSLTTDLLNHLVFVQKVFMKEVNEVVQKVYGGEKPVPIWLEDSDEATNSLSNRILFSLVIQMQRIQLTATTASSSAVRLETGAVVLELSNRVKNMSGSTSSRLFGKAQVDLNLSLGQLIRNALFEEADAEFQQFAFFNTRIGLRNAFQDEMVEGDDKEVVLITLKRPLVYIQPVAVDKAILVWLNYKNAYDYWNEKRANLNKEVISATQQVYEKFQIGQITSQIGTPHVSTLFLQLTVEDMGICLPLNPLPLTNWRQRSNTYEEGRGAVVITLENTSISACSSGSLVSKGKFSNLCLRFADDFETSLDDWKPDMSDSAIMNLCVVSDGTYEVCSRTIAAKLPTENAKWFLNVQWQMEGVDIHLDVNVGKQLSALGHTLTMLTGAEETTHQHSQSTYADLDISLITSDASDDDTSSPLDPLHPSTSATNAAITTNRHSSSSSKHHHNRHSHYSRGGVSNSSSATLITGGLGGGVLGAAGVAGGVAGDALGDGKKRSRLIEQEMNEQAKIINDLRSLGASHGTIELELKRLHELETLVYQDFRRDMIQKLRRQSMKSASIGGKLKQTPAQTRGTAYRSRSFVVPSPMLENSMEENEDSSPNLLIQSSAAGTGPGQGGGISSFDSSPHSGPSRSASLKVKSSTHVGDGKVAVNIPQVRNTYSPSSVQRGVTFSEPSPPMEEYYQQYSNQQSYVERQPSLASGGSDMSLPEPPTDWGTGGEIVDINGERIEFRKKAGYENCDKEPFPYTGGNNFGASQKAQEPNIDLELDVKVFINSGKCVLHTKDTAKDEEIKLRMRKDRSCSAGLLEFPPPTASPDPSRRTKEKLASQSSSSRLRSNVPHPTLVDLTIFHIPGLDVKLHYQSKVITDDALVLDSDCAPSTPAVYPDPSPYPNPAPPTHSLFRKQTSFDTFVSPPGMIRGSDTKAACASTDSVDCDVNTILLEADDEAARIDEAFGGGGGRSGGYSGYYDGMKNSASLQLGISNPNYSPTASSSRGSLDQMLLQGNVDHNVFGGVNNDAYTKSTNNSQRRSGMKKASLFAWMTLQSVPEETIISPHILEFLEQTLEPIPTDKTPTSLLSSEGDTLATYGNYVYASFPVDVIVYFHMQPSTFRFSCLPVSRVECMLQLPSLDIVFSSKRAEDELLLHSEFGGGEGGNPNASTSGAPTAVGGLSVTGCLSDFSVYIFHPYGGKKSALKEAQWSPLSDSERKDSLSVNVEFVKFHLSRSRMMNFKQDANLKGGKTTTDSSRNVIRFSTITDIGSASFKYDMRRLTEILAFPKAWYRRSIVRRMFLGDLSISATCNDEEEAILIGNSGYPRVNRPRSGNEKSPLLAKPDKLPKLRDAFSKTSFSIDSSHTLTDSPSPEHKNVTGWETLVLFAVNFKKLNVHMNMGNVMGNVSWLTKDFRSEGRLGIGSTGHKNLYITLGLCGSGLDAKGGIVGGNIELANIDTYIHIREEPNVEPDHRVGLKLRALELRLDYMATSVLMCRASELSVNLRDEWVLNQASNSAMIPTRRPASIFMHVGMTWDQLQLMMSKSSTTDLLKMFNKLEEFFSQQFNSSKRAFSSFSGGGSGRTSKVTPQRSRDISSSSSSGQPSSANQPSSNADSDYSSSVSDSYRLHRHWQRVLATVAQLQLNTMHVPLPSFGTVLGGRVDLHGNNISLACFHGINFKSKSWALFSLKEPCITFNTEAQEIPQQQGGSVQQTGGDTSTEQDVHIVQTMTCSLGSSTYKTHQSMATVCKVSRTVIFPPQFKSLQEWFHYAFANSQIDDVDRFPSLERERESANSMERAGRGSMTASSSIVSTSSGTSGFGSSGSSSSQKLVDPNHTREVIFALPSLELHLKTEHLQMPLTTAQIAMPLEHGISPVVECSFITEFEDHIFVTVDAESFFFLHDLITSYIKEKDRVLSSTQFDRRHTKPTHLPTATSTSSATSNPSTANATPTTSRTTTTSNRFPTLNSPSAARPSLDTLIRDGRTYNCKTWHLEPTVRLLSVAGKYIEPYGIDYILQKLGFAHARTTIPKWMQRGFMDPLDAILSVLTFRMVMILKGEGGGKEPVVVLGHVVEAKQQR